SARRGARSTPSFRDVSTRSAALHGCRSRAMPVMVLKGATKLTDVLTDLTADVPAAGRDAVATAIRDANPQLGQKPNPAAGTLLPLPGDVADRLGKPDLSKIVTQRPPAAAAAAGAGGETMKTFAARLKSALSTETDDIKAVGDALKSAPVKAVV